MDKIFVVGIGGTGMRCLESFVHMCAMGMFDNHEVHLLALDTDRDNGNFRRLKELVNIYQNAKGVDREHHPLEQTFFSAKIQSYTFSPDYSTQSTGKFSRITRMGDLKDQDPKAADLAELLLTSNSREFDLKHGYRAQTHIGSFLMYHGIVQEVMQNHNGQLAKFIEELANSSKNLTTKVFVMGSVFGGTGASSIPVIPEAFERAAQELMPGTSLKGVVFYGSILLTNYFTFSVPSRDELKKQLVVATSEKFALNSQAAMMFYNGDETVNKTYQKFYMLGTPGVNFKVDENQGSTQVATGGAKQENPSHFIELFAAAAAYDFFNTPQEELEELRDKDVQYYFRTVDNSGKIEFGDLVKPSEVERFAKRFGLLVAMSMVANKEYFLESAVSGNLAKKDNIFGYEDIDPREVEAIRKYFNLFHYSMAEGRVLDGWLRQMYNSAGGGDKFLFHADLLGMSTEKELRKLDYNKRIYKTDFEKNKYDTGLFGNPFDSFKEAFKKREDDPALPNKIEKLTKRIYMTLCDLYKFPVESGS